MHLLIFDRAWGVTSIAVVQRFQGRIHGSVQQMKESLGHGYMNISQV